MSNIAPTLQLFFTDRLISQRRASENTIQAYRISFILLLGYASQIRSKTPSTLDFEDLDAPLIGDFLNHLETVRHNGVRTRNNRLAAIHSFFTYAALRHPEHAATIQRVLAIVPKRFDSTLVTYLTDEEVDAFLGACNQDTWTGRRDFVMFQLTLQTGLRISEVRNLTGADISLGRGANVHCQGKGRKERRTPLLAETVANLHRWQQEQAAQPADPLFPTSTGHQLSRDAIEHRIKHYVTLTARSCHSLRSKNVTMHTLRHTCAMRLLSSGVDITVIALWLGHSQLSSTNAYIHADMAQKERAVARITPPGLMSGRYHPADPLLGFLQGL